MDQNEFSGNLEKYKNPIEYDVIYENYNVDLHYIKNLLRKNSDPIIELACGTGRLAIPLAKQGFNVYAIDIHEGMLQLAIDKAKKQNVQVHFSLQDCTQLQLPISSNFIYMTGNSFQHFLTNDSQNALFQSVKKHLHPGGEFVFDTRNALLNELSIVDEYEESSVNSKGEKLTIQHREEYNPVTQILTCRSINKLGHSTFEDSILLRYTYPMELKRLLEQNDFELLHLYGSWKKSEFTKDSPSMIVHARLTKQNP
ncbi:class I SAM-dependent methyltransferase [Lysinibacillus sp. fls2-241-R2A-57]|uniref:class I SAM-dependent methyltransferase n=1 Tax=Lysinibacillus sp. fls2-241-R2A-57 TaxID=3040292 RepID=UPI0025561407|nr:class I SAM-dependent methyltransferase [Lysinibacillus sp. fls2-241-R2A-57]